MKRSSVLKLKEPVWVTPVVGDPLEVSIVPAEASMLALIWAGADEASQRTFCTDAFIGFRGYTEEDGKPVADTVENRMDLFGVMPVRRKIVTSLQELAEIQAEGEGSADSD